MEFNLQYRSLLPSEAFNILRGLCANAVANDEADRDCLSPDTRICDLYWLGDELAFGASRIARCVGPLFEIDVPAGEWKKAIAPTRQKTVADLCEFLARHAVVPIVPAYRIVGRPCRAAGAFLTIRELLRGAETDTANLSPSTALECFSETGLPQTWKKLIHMGPSLLDRMRCNHHWDLPFMLLAIGCFFAAVAGGVVSADHPAIGLPMAMASILLFFVTWRISEIRAATPSRVVFDGLMTFRDLSKYIEAEISQDSDMG